MNIYYNHDQLPQYMKIGPSHENQLYANKNIDPEMNFLNKQLAEEERMHKLKKAKQAEEFSVYSQNGGMGRPSSYSYASRHNYDNLTGKVGQERRSDMKYGIPVRTYEEVSKSYFRNPRSHYTHGYNIVNNTVCNIKEEGLQSQRSNNVQGMSNEINNQQYELPSQFQLHERQLNQMEVAKAQGEYNTRRLEYKPQRSTIEEIQDKESELLNMKRKQQEMQDEYDKRQYEQQRRKIEYENELNQRLVNMKNNTQDTQNTQRNQEMPPQQQYQPPQQEYQPPQQEYQPPQQEYQPPQQENQPPQQQYQPSQQQYQPSSDRITEEQYKRAYEEFMRQEQLKQTYIPKEQPQESTTEYKRITPLNQDQQTNSNPSISESEYQAYLEYMKRKDKDQFKANRILTPQRVIDYNIKPNKTLTIPQKSLKPTELTEQDYIKIKEQAEFEYYNNLKNQPVPNPNPGHQNRILQDTQQEMASNRIKYAEEEYARNMREYHEQEQRDTESILAMKNYHQSSNSYHKTPQESRLHNPNAYLKNYQLPKPQPTYPKSNYVASNPYSNKIVDLGTSNLSSNPITFPVNSYKFNYNRFLQPEGNRLASSGSNIIGNH